MPHTIHINETINAPVQNIWHIMRNFNGLQDYHDAILESRIEYGDTETVGSIRNLTLAAGGYVREKLLMLNDQTHTFEYAIIDGTLPVANYTATVKLTYDEDNNHTACEWWANFDVTDNANAEELIQMIGEGVFRAGFQSVARLCKTP